MEGDSIGRTLQKKFPKSSLEDWKKIALQETQGKDPFEILSWRGKDEILFLPYYDAATDAELHFLERFRLPADLPSPRTWQNLAFVNVCDEKSANKQALDHLMNGADGMLFDVRNIGDLDVNALINNIEWPHCSIDFYVNEKNSKILPSLAPLIQSKFAPDAVKGALFWELIPKKSTVDFYVHECNHIHSIGHLIPASSPAAEISEALLKGIHSLELLSAAGDMKEIFRSIAFSISANAPFLECIAKFKALRMLWFQVAHTYGYHDYKPDDVYIHARSSYMPDGAFGPHENMLAGTFAAMAAILGGCSSVCVQTPADAAPFISRWARNVSAILREESFLNRAADPTAGAWTVQRMTDEIAKKAWALFQQNCLNHAAT